VCPPYAINRDILTPLEASVAHCPHTSFALFSACVRALRWRHVFVPNAGMNKRRAESGGGSGMGGLTGGAGGGRGKAKSGLTFVDNDANDLKPASSKAKGGCC